MTGPTKAPGRRANVPGHGTEEFTFDALGTIPAPTSPRVSLGASDHRRTTDGT
jgi:hypothetical protein